MKQFTRITFDPVAYSKDDALKIAKAFLREAARRHDIKGFLPLRLVSAMTP
jgi:hypothetical protein